MGPKAGVQSGFLPSQEHTALFARAPLRLCVRTLSPLPPIFRWQNRISIAWLRAALCNPLTTILTAGDARRAGPTFARNRALFGIYSRNNRANPPIPPRKALLVRDLCDVSGRKCRNFAILRPPSHAETPRSSARLAPGARSRGLAGRGCIGRPWRGSIVLCGRTDSCRRPRRTRPGPRLGASG